MEPGTAEHDALLRAFREAVRARFRQDIAEESARATALRETVLPVVREVVGGARAEGVCRRVWLFGSFAWGEPTPASDIDLLVEGDERELGYRVGKATEREVHALALDEAPASLVARCQSDGVVL